ERSCLRGDVQIPEFEAWWRVHDRPSPPVEPVWLNDFLVRQAYGWSQEEMGSIIWFEHRAFGEHLKAYQIPVFSGGEDASREILRVTPETHPAIACSIKAHGTGLNLQAYSRNLLVTPPSNAQTWEQTLGRTHRPGQAADRVTVDVYLHTE